MSHRLNARAARADQGSERVRPGGCARPRTYLPAMPPANRIWKCPNCADGVRAPARMRRDDARRLCLPCTGETGRFVERFCPSLDRERAEKAGRQEERRRQKAERERQEALDRRSVDGLDLQRELRRLCRLPSLGGRSGPLASHPPELRVRHVSSRQRRVLSWSAGGYGSLVIAAWPGRSAEDAAAWLLSGVVSVFRCRTRTTRSVRALLGDAAGEAWPGVRVRGRTETEYARALAQALTDAGALQRASGAQPSR